MATDSQVKFRGPRDISGGLQRNSFAALAYTTVVDMDSTQLVQVNSSISESTIIIF